MKEPNDWRLQGQDEYMKGIKLLKTEFAKTSTNDHEHCKFCVGKFGEEPENFQSG